MRSVNKKQNRTDVDFGASVQMEMQHIWDFAASNSVQRLNKASVSRDRLTASARD